MMFDANRESWDEPLWTPRLDAGRLASSGAIRGPWRAPLRRRAEVWVANTLLGLAAIAAAWGGGWVIEHAGERIMLWWMGL